MTEVEQNFWAQVRETGISQEGMDFIEDVISEADCIIDRCRSDIWDNKDLSFPLHILYLGDSQIKKLTAEDYVSSVIKNQGYTDNLTSDQIKYLITKTIVGFIEQHSVKSIVMFSERYTIEAPSSEKAKEIYNKYNSLRDAPESKETVMANVSFNIRGRGYFANMICDIETDGEKRYLSDAYTWSLFEENDIDGKAVIDPKKLVRID